GEARRSDIQKGGERRQLGPDALLVGMVVRTPMRIAALLAFVVLPAVPAFAQIDLTGTWGRSGQSDNVYAVEPVDLLGIPLNEDGRAKALSYDIAALSA